MVLTMAESINNNLLKRPPVVTVMGHVDHGKTSLLDAIARTNVAAKEVGGITQGISAFTVPYEERKITFVDTPGHEAFLSMRKRGGKVADIILLIIAGPEGVKPQTQEAIAHIKDSQATLIVVITKTDLPETNVEKVKRQLADNGVLVEGFGGQVPVVEVSIKDPDSIKRLLDLILLSADLSGVLGSPNEAVTAIVVESVVDRQKGPMTLCVVRSGVLTPGQDIHTPTVSARIRGLFRNGGESLLQISAGETGWIMGFNKVPKVGEQISDGKLDDPNKPSVSGAAIGRQVPVNEGSSLEEAANLKMILKADSLGSLEALETSLAQILQGSGSVEVVASGVGDINDGDIYKAIDSKAPVIGFKVRTLGSAADLAREREVEIQTYEIIYKLIEDIKLGLLGLNQWKKKTSRPEADILKIFELPSGDRVLGCKVVSGALRVGQGVLVKRKDTDLFKSSIKSIKIGKKSSEKISAPSECGLLLFAKDVSSIEPGDKVVAI
jgi:translation initiation factor IF-2